MKRITLALLLSSGVTGAKQKSDRSISIGNTTSNQTVSDQFVLPTPLDPQRFDNVLPEVSSKKKITAVKAKKTTTKPTTSTTAPPTPFNQPASTTVGFLRDNNQMYPVSWSSYTKNIGVFVPSLQDCSDLFNAVVADLRQVPGMKDLLSQVKLDPLTKNISPTALGEDAALFAIEGEFFPSTLQAIVADDTATVFAVHSLFKGPAPRRGGLPTNPNPNQVAQAVAMYNRLVQLMPDAQAFMNKNKYIIDQPLTGSSFIDDLQTEDAAYPGKPLAIKDKTNLFRYSEADGINQEAGVNIANTALSLDQFLLQLGALLSLKNRGFISADIATQNLIEDRARQMFSVMFYGVNHDFVPAMGILAQVAQQYYEEGWNLQDQPSMPAALQRLLRLTPVLTTIDIMQIANMQSSALQTALNKVKSNAESWLAVMNQEFLAQQVQEAVTAAEGKKGEYLDVNPYNTVPPLSTFDALLADRDFASLRMMMQPTLEITPGNDQIGFYGDWYQSFIMPLGEEYSGWQFYSAVDTTSGNVVLPDNAGHLVEMIYWMVRVCKDDQFFASVYTSLTRNINDLDPNQDLNVMQKQLDMLLWVRGNAEDIFSDNPTLGSSGLTNEIVYLNLKYYVTAIDALIQQYGSQGKLIAALGKLKGTDVSVIGKLTNQNLLNYLSKSGSKNMPWWSTGTYAADMAAYNTANAIRAADELAVANIANKVANAWGNILANRRALRSKR